MDDRGIEERLSTLGRELRPEKAWQENVWRQIGADEAQASAPLPASQVQTKETRRAAARLVLVPALLAPPTLVASCDSLPGVKRRPARPSWATPLISAGTAFAMAALMMLVLLSESQSAAAEKKLRIAASEIAELHEQIDQKLQELDSEHEEGRAAFRELWYAKADQTERTSVHEAEARPARAKANTSLEVNVPGGSP